MSKEIIQATTARVSGAWKVQKATTAMGIERLSKDQAAPPVNVWIPRWRSCRRGYTAHPAALYVGGVNPEVGYARTGPSRQQLLETPASSLW